MYMIETYKIVSEKYNPLVAPTKNKECSYLDRGNDKKITEITMEIRSQKISFHESCG